jgi:aminopeptidase YwaD
MKKITAYLCLHLIALSANAQDIQYAKYIVQELCSPEYFGRGYVNDGVNKSAHFLEKEYKKLKLKPIHDTYTQPYSFPVNTHPNTTQCKFDDITLNVGTDYLINPGSKSIDGKFLIRYFNWNDSLEKILLATKLKKGFQKNEALVIRFSSQRASHILDSIQKYHHTPALIIFTEEKKLTHSIATQLDDIASITTFDSLIFNKENITIHIENDFKPNFQCKNIIGQIKGKRNDSILVFSAHYDHLGMQAQAMFPGASDNASGVSMILSLAKYYAKNKPNYNLIFLLFSGEEAGLLGSQYFTEHPSIDLKKIKMLINIDIMGNAEGGITIVNGEIHKTQFNLITHINNKEKYLPTVKIRGQAKNSDHYYFTQKGVPAFFIYSNGGKGFYHDVYDTAENINFTNYENVFQLVKDFANSL